METLFLFCAIFGGTVLVAQFLLGLGGGAEGDDGPGGSGSADGDEHHVDSTWIFGVLSFRTMMIGLTIFGLTGRASIASGFEQPAPLAIAIGCGLAAMYGVYFLMRGLYRLTADGTVRIDRAVGEEAMVYLTIPGHNEGVGKVHVPVQNRTVEYEAMTAGERLPTGTRVIVVGVLGSDRVTVEPVIEPARESHV